MNTGKRFLSVGKRQSYETVRPDYARIGYLLFCFLLYFFWSVTKELNYGPDEGMRYLIPEYIYRTGSLPDGNLPELRNELWGFSYAFYPNFLGPILSAGCMKIVSFFSDGMYALVAAARFPGVLCAAGSVWLAFRTGERVFGRRGAWIYAVSLSMIPQFVFLASYVNNDMLCIFGASVILDAWVSVRYDGWQVKNGLGMAAGIIIVALSYYNGYGWILCSILFFAGSWIWKTDKNAYNRKMAGIGLLISITVLVGIGYFFVRNALLYEGDFLGMRTLSAAAEQYAAPGWKPSEKETPLTLGMSVWQMFISSAWTGTPWIVKLFVTFVGAFGFADVFLPLWIYGFYGVLFLIMAAGACGCLISWIKKQKEDSKKERKKTVLFYSVLGLTFLIPPALCVWYSYAVDYQPQGRYCYPMLPVFFWFGTQGLLWITEKTGRSEAGKKGLAGGYCAVMVLLTVFVTCTVYL